MNSSCTPIIDTVRLDLEAFSGLGKMNSSCTPIIDTAAAVT